MADLNPEQLRILEDLIEGLDRVSTRARNVGDAFEQQLGKNWQKKMQAAADAAADLAKAQTAAAMSSVKNMDKKQREATIEAAGKRAAARVQREYDENARAVSGTLEQMGQAVTKLTRSIYTAEAGQKKYAEAVDGVVTALGTLAFFMGGPMIKVLSTVVMGLTKFFRASTEMGDALFKNYQEISRFGAASGEGTDGIYGLMQSMRLSTDQLGQLTQLISENAHGLALFKGTVFSGAKGLGDLRKEATRTGLELEAFGLGMTPQELNERMGAFITQQAQLGAMDVKTTNAAVKSLREYIFETDRITKITGASAKQQEDAMNRAMAIEQFRVKIAELEAEGTEESRAEARRLSTTFKILSATSPGLANAFAQATTGILGPEGVGAQLATQGQIFQVANARGLDVAEGLDRIGKGLRSQLGPGGIVPTLGRFGGLQTSLGLSINELYNLGKITEDQAEKLAQATSVQEVQALLQAKGIDVQAQAMQADLNAMQSMQGFVNLGVGPATAALAGLARVVESLTSLLPRSAGQVVGATGGAAGGMAVGAGIGAIGGPVGAGIGAVIGGITGFLGGSALFGGGAAPAAGGRAAAPGAAAEPKINPEDVIKFSGGMTGTRQHFDRLEPRVRDAFMAMALEYNNLTGDKLQINSAFRSPGEQAAVNSNGNPKAAPGMSLHNVGRAIDIQTDQKNRLVAMGLLGRHGFKHLGDTDPPHIYMQTGGIATGPRSGYSATLHGTEAVVPLPDGKTIPVAMPNLDRSMEQQVGMLSAQLMALQDLVRVMRDNNSISTKILQATNN